MEEFAPTMQTPTSPTCNDGSNSVSTAIATYIYSMQKDLFIQLAI